MVQHSRDQEYMTVLDGAHVDDQQVRAIVQNFRRAEIGGTRISAGVKLEKSLLLSSFREVKLAVIKGLFHQIDTELGRAFLRGTALVQLGNEAELTRDHLSRALRHVVAKHALCVQFVPLAQQDGIEKTFGVQGVVQGVLASRIHGVATGIIAQIVQDVGDCLEISKRPRTLAHCVPWAPMRAFVERKDSAWQACGVHEFVTSALRVLQVVGRVGHLL
mmetsp:Transcript_25080/g.54565  ORF Transcript_25080/g.54565 Transcript_25080/m.54565 type:complete len:218 (+) Transcript_25080:956-1609(+)